jgi:hypothetical protein
MMIPPVAERSTDAPTSCPASERSSFSRFPTFS